MLSGAPPFQSEDALEVVHAHIARTPPSLDDGVPTALRGLVQRLLAKNAEDRYQSSHGIAHDLRRAQESLDSGEADFELGQDDRADVLRLPDQLYGREAEQKELLDTFERVVVGQTELLLVAGYSGIGKSALVHEVHRPIVARRGVFIAGKYEQYRRDVPYLGFAGAFGDLVRQLLTLSAPVVAEWRDRITGAVGEVAQVLIDVIPEMELLIGAQVPVPEVPPVEAEQRFSAAFQNFLRVFAGGDEPLVIFLDDLQWADQASLKLIKLLMDGREGLRLFLVGAYRDNEVFPAHPLMVMRDDLVASDAPTGEIALGPLTKEHVEQLTADTLRVDRADAADLAHLLHEKTGGNPFFLRQFFEMLYAEDLVRMEARQWTWDLRAIDALESTTNVVDLMVARIRKLSPEAQEVLRWGAAIGAQFDLATIASATGKRRRAVAEALWEAVEIGQVLPLSEEGRATVDELRLSGEMSTYVADLADRYRFLHDRVQQAAYSLIDPDELASMHYRIGQSIWTRTDEADLDEVGFEIVAHLNQCLELIEDPAARRRLAELNIATARRAKQSTAYQAALRTVNAATELLADASWDDEYDLLLQLTAERAECEYLVGDFDAADALFDRIIEKAADLAGRLLVYEKKVVLLRHKAEYEEALRAIVEGLALAGVEVPWHDDAERIGAILADDGTGLREQLEGRDVDALIDLPAMTDAVDLAVMDLLAELSMLAYFFNPALIQLSTVKMVTRSLASGNCRSSTVAYATYGMAIASGLGLYEEGYKFGRLSIALAQKLRDPAAECTVRFWHGAAICHWRAPVAEGLEILKTGTEQALRAGAPVYASYNCFFIPSRTCSTVPARHRRWWARTAS